MILEDCGKYSKIKEGLYSYNFFNRGKSILLRYVLGLFKKSNELLM
ncbi:hypothetical protein [Clostridium sp.]